MFQPVSNQVDFAAQENEVLAFWKRTGAFDRLRQLLATSEKRYSFIDGPITANNPMGVHHAWGRTYKDLWQRYKAMLGYNQRWQNGFDCQGLWVEVNVEKELGFKSKRDIEEYGMTRFIALCKERVLKSAATQTDQTIRLGNWMDWNDTDELRMLAAEIVKDPQKHITLKRGDKEVHGTVEQLVGQLGMPDLQGSYFTFSDENNYQIWSFLKKCYENGWVYRGTDSIPWCPRCGTGISQHEIDTEGYKDREDYTITARFRLKTLDTKNVAWQNDGAEKFAATPNRYLLAWTTTPWTLPANVMAAVGPKMTYVLAMQTHKDGEQAIYILSKGTQKMLKGEFEVLGEMIGADLAGATYQGIFDDLPAWIDANKTWADKHGFEDDRIFEHCVIPWDEVGEDEGTGIVHIAPGCGPEDHQLGKLHSSPMVGPLDEEGNYLPSFGEFSGKFAHDVPEQVANALKKKGYFYKHDTYVHRYAHCWRCGSPLVYRLVGEWYISMDTLRHDMMRVSEQINWIPAFGKERELDWLKNMHDWMISKKRYWGLALPIWEYPDGTFEVIGSYEELKERAVEGWQEFDGHTPHRPWIDKVKIKDKNGQIGTRVPDVGNPWLDAGIVAYSTLRYRTDREYWEKWFPASFITESFPGQFRNWFYSLIAMSTVLEQTQPTNAILGFATLMDEHGKPMHKSSGNMIEFNEAAEKEGADVMRWVYARQRVDDNLNFGYHYMEETRRHFILPLWNVYSFFVTYANADGWQPTADRGRGTDASPSSVSSLPSSMDKWILARLTETTNAVIAGLEAWEARPPALAIEQFVDDLTNWYVRRNRERFWRAGQDADKQAAYATLYECLTTLTKLIAPFMPFMAEAMWQNLTRQTTVREMAAQPGAFSIHHQSYPQPRELSAEEKALLREVAIARTVVNLGHSLRAQSKIKVRQPLGRIMVVADEAGRAAITAQREAIAGELNIKQVEFAAQEEQLVTYKILPDLKKLGKKLGAAMPAVRKALETADAAQIAHAVKTNAPIVLTANGQSITLAPDEVLVSIQPKGDLLVAGEGGVVVALDTHLTDALIQEGLAREVVRRINDARKEANFSLSDRITAEYAASPRLAQVISAFDGYVKAETLAVELRPGPAESGKADEFDGETLKIVVKKV